VGNPDAMDEMLEEIPVGKIKDNTIILMRCNASRNNPPDESSEPTSGRTLVRAILRDLP
jgi:hypothetical protein